MRSPHSLALLGVGLLAATGSTLPARTATACGCFANPNPAVPVVQAGERILFSYEDGVVTAHIQIQYSGDADRFGWLVPLPSQPEVALGIEDLFTQLIQQTQPRYSLQRTFGDTCAFASEAGDGRTDDQSGPPGDGDGTIVVAQGSIGAFDYSVLKADDKVELLEWLDTNRYFVPAGSDDAIDPYIYDGAYFLAVKLSNGAGVDEIQPIVVKYASDLPMIPIVLTSIGAEADMGIMVWVLGNSRAIPRNYRHTVINYEKIDWFTFGSNYNDVIIAATNEASEGQSFVTEYAGPSNVMRGLLDFEGRFGTESEFANATDAATFAGLLNQRGFAQTPQLLSILEQTFPMPAVLVDQGVTREDYYFRLSFYAGEFRDQNPEIFEGVDLSFDPAALAARLWERIVMPSRDASVLFDRFPKMTRMYTTLSPDEMTRDPVFSFNPELPDVSNVHLATFETDCDNFQRGVLVLPDGRRFNVDSPNQWTDLTARDVPFSRRIEVLREEGAPLIAVDNTTRISAGLSDGGCSCAGSTAPSTTSAWLAAIGFGVLLFGLRRRS